MRVRFTCRFRATFRCGVRVRIRVGVRFRVIVRVRVSDMVRVNHGAFTFDIYIDGSLYTYIAGTCLGILGFQVRPHLQG